MRKHNLLHKNVLGLFFLAIICSSLTACAPSASTNGVRVAYNSLFAPSDRGTVWRGMRSHMAMPANAHRPEVQKQIAWYQAHPKHFNHLMKQSAPYIAYVHQELRKRKLPSELALIPVIESDYNPSTRTRSSGASGLWQFMPRTATNYNLKMNRWYDGRYDVHASTHAALDYFTYLKGHFHNDWLLAMAGYNYGENGVARSAHRNARQGQAHDFWNIRLPRETKRYVPKILALAAIIKDPGRYNLQLPPISDKPNVQPVNVGKQIALKHAAKIAGLPHETVRKLNPGYRRGVTAPNGPHLLVMPATHAETFKIKLAAAIKENQILVSQKDYHEDSLKFSSNSTGKKGKKRHHNKYKKRIHVAKRSKKRRSSLVKVAQQKAKHTPMKKWKRSASRKSVKPNQV
jgi:soluble lytic murein transglycosylase-like protein